ncbi:MAG: HAD hydrolase-like protein, partial [Candidatus Gastranaerophilales bacterium]|nr:HAD hydrolase-like protein [Candidatus Gastranaerophilales bacterium]
IESSGCRHDKVVMIGDSYHDAEAAGDLGIDFIGVTYGFGFKNEEEVRKYNPIFTANSANGIIEYMKKSDDNAKVTI